MIEKLICIVLIAILMLYTINVYQDVRDDAKYIVTTYEQYGEIG